MQQGTRSSVWNLSGGAWRSGGLLLAAQLLALAPVVAQDTGFEGPTFPGTVGTPTESKPQNKLWFNDGFWWGACGAARARATASTG